MKVDYLTLIYDQLPSPEYGSSNLRAHLNDYDADLRSKLEIEIKCFELYLEGGRLEPESVIGNIKETDIEKLNASEVNYIKERLASEKESFLIARYAHILFEKTRDNRFAIRAIAAYRLMASHYLQLLATKEKNIIDFMDMVQAYAQLSSAVKYQTDTCRDDIISWYLKADQSAFYYQCLIQLMATSKIFKADDVLDFTDKALTYASQLRPGYEAEDFLEACLLLAKKEGVDQKVVYILMAENQLRLANKRPDSTGLIKNGCYLKASQHYKKAKENDKSNEILRLLHQHKKNVKLSPITVRTDVTENRKLVSTIADYMLLSQPRTMFIALAIDRRLLPDLAKFKPSKDAAFLNSVQLSSFDINGNTQILNDFEKKRREIFMDVKFRVELMIPFLIEDLVSKMKRTNRDFMAEGLDYFDHTWFQNQLVQTNLSDEQFTYRWMDSLRPALEILLKINMQDKRQLLSAAEQMALDQLAVKFEGLLRDLCEMAGLTTTKVREDQTVNKDVNELLQSDELNTKFQKEDLDFWLYTFTACGYNIRNNVAHAFYREHNYTVALSNIVLVAYVRLAKYNDIVRHALKQKDQQESPDSGK